MLVSEDREKIYSDIKLSNSEARVMTGESTAKVRLWRKANLSMVKLDRCKKSRRKWIHGEYQMLANFSLTNKEIAIALGRDEHVVGMKRTELFGKNCRGRVSRVESSNVNKGKDFKYGELKEIVDMRLCDKELAAKFGRSVGSIKMARKKYKKLLDSE